jgi:tRNA (guanosine-2'-O-)-methyltransferase
MDIPNKQALIEYLFSFITDNKQELIKQVLAHRTKHVTILLEDVFQEHNASAVLRSSEILGLQEIHIVEKRFNFRVTNSVAMGASKWLDMKHYKSTLDAITALKQQGYRIIATTPHEKGCFLEQLPLDSKFALVFGTENVGLSQEALELADEYVAIPMHGFTQSFNISVSVALCLYHIMNALRSSSIEWQLTQQQKEDISLAWAKKIVRGSDVLIEHFLKNKQ